VLPEEGIREGRTCVALDEDDIAVGFATYLINNGVAQLEDLSVDPLHMRRRIGEQLVLDISERVNALGFKTPEVTANPHAMAFYEYMGFVIDQVVDTEFYPAPECTERPLEPPQPAPVRHIGAPGLWQGESPADTTPPPVTVVAFRPRRRT
jgi:ribosomal protein S18 acetylase RimI-like enzyme